MAHAVLLPLLIAAGSAAATAGVSALVAPKPQVQTPQVATPTIQQNPAAEAMRNSDLLRTRIGAAANNLTGGNAAAPTPGVRALFGQGG